MYYLEHNGDYHRNRESRTSLNGCSHFILDKCYGPEMIESELSAVDAFFSISLLGTNLTKSLALRLWVTVARRV